MFGFVALACHGPCHRNSPSAARHGPTLPEEMERVWSEGFDRRKEKKAGKKKTIFADFYSISRLFVSGHSTWFAKWRMEPRGVGAK